MTARVAPAGSEAPLFTACFALTDWLLGRLGDDARVLPKAICRAALALLRAITLALKGRNCSAHLRSADEELIALRVLLRLAGQGSVLADSQMLYALERARVIGRQLGGWQRARAPAHPC